MAGGNSGSSGNSAKTFGNSFAEWMNKEKQSKHIPGKKEYTPGKSIIDVSVEELEQLIRENIDNAIMLPNGKMILDLPKDIGIVISKDGKNLGKTNRITIHNSNTGYHAVPAKRGNKKGGKK